MTQGKFVRYTLLSGRGRQATEDGVFIAAYDLVHDFSIPVNSRNRLIELLAWFRSNLKVPTRFNKGGGKGWYRRQTRGLSWFKPEAQECLSKMRALVELLHQHNVPTQQFNEARVGYIVYEDENQVVAEPFAKMK